MYQRQVPYPNQYQESKSQSGTSRILKPQLRLKGHGSSLHLQNQCRQPKIRSWIYQRQVTVSKTRSGFPAPVMNIQLPRKQF